MAALVLEALTEGPRTGFEISEFLESQTGTSLGRREGALQRLHQGDYSLLSLRGREGALYAELIQLEREGFIEGEWSEAPEGRRRRSYRLPVLVDLNALTAPETSVAETGATETGVTETGAPEVEE